MRADVQLDKDVLRAATRAVFAESSVDAPLEKIAERSGIDVHTIQSHFINRAALIAFALEEELDSYASAIAHLRGEHKAGVALTLWTQRYVEFLLATRGLAACLSASTADDDGLAFYFEKRLGTALQALLDEAFEAGEMQATQAPHLLLAVAGGSAVWPARLAPRKPVAWLPC